MEMKFFKCKKCGKILAILKDTGMPTICCGEEMIEIKPGMIDASLEKHVPVIIIKGLLVEIKVGAVDHPMEEKHYIEWICIKTNYGYYFREMKPGFDPKVTFRLSNGERIEKAYAYCNLHGLWLSEA